MREAGAMWTGRLQMTVHNEAPHWTARANPDVRRDPWQTETTDPAIIDTDTRVCPSRSGGMPMSGRAAKLGEIKMFTAVVNDPPYGERSADVHAPA